MCYIQTKEHVTMKELKSKRKRHPTNTTSRFIDSTILYENKSWEMINKAGNWGACWGWGNRIHQGSWHMDGGIAASALQVWNHISIILK